MTGEKKAAATKYHRKALLTAADRLLVEHGYDGMNMNMLCKEAHYSKATVYVYFRSKDEIVGELACERLKLLRGEIGLVLKSDLDVDGKFAEIGSILGELARDDRTYFDFITSKPFAADGKLKAIIDGIMSDLAVIAPEDVLKSRWYAFYGRIKTANMFDEELS